MVIAMDHNDFGERQIALGERYGVSHPSAISCDSVFPLSSAFLIYGLAGNSGES